MVGGWSQVAAKAAALPRSAVLYSVQYIQRPTGVGGGWLSDIADALTSVKTTLLLSYITPREKV